MNTAYLDTLPEVTNKFNVDLEADEKVVFTAKLSTFGTEADRMLGMDSDFTLTNRRIIADNHVGIWTVDIAEEIVSCTKVETGKFLFKATYFSVTLNTEVVFDYGKQRLTGFHFYFNKADTPVFEEIMNHL